MAHDFCEDSDGSGRLSGKQSYMDKWGSQLHRRYSYSVLTHRLQGPRLHAPNRSKVTRSITEAPD